MNSMDTWEFLKDIVGGESKTRGPSLPMRKAPSTSNVNGTNTMSTNHMVKQEVPLKLFQAENGLDKKEANHLDAAFNLSTSTDEVDNPLDNSEGPLVAAKQAINHLNSYITSLELKASKANEIQAVSYEAIKSAEHSLQSAKKDVADSAAEVMRLEGLLAGARNELLNAKQREGKCERNLEEAKRSLVKVQVENSNVGSQLNGAEKASRHLKECYSYLEDITPKSPKRDGPESWIRQLDTQNGFHESSQVNDVYMKEMPLHTGRVEEEAKRQEEEARQMAVERSRREKEELLRTRRRTKSTPATSATMTSELVDMSSTARREESSKKVQNDIQSTSDERGLTKCPTSTTKENTSISREEIRSRLSDKLAPFMPISHTLRATSMGSVPPRSHAKPGNLCNHHCSTSCLKQCAAGFLLAMEIDIVHSGNQEVSLDSLIGGIKYGLRKFHPDRNTIRRVGESKAMYSEEVCKDLSLLQCLMETTQEVTFVLVLQNKDNAKMKVTMSMSDNILDLKKRIVEEYREVDMSSLMLRLSNKELKDEDTMGSCSIKENCIIQVQSSNKGWTTF